jgi:TonB family protein
MSASAPLPRLFGPYLLTRELSRDPLGGVFRAGTTGSRALKPFVLIRAFDGEAIDRAALLPAMETAVEYLDDVRGQAVAKGAVLGVVDDTPFAGIDYMPGLTLHGLLQGGEQGPVPLPVEHALLIAEKVLISLEAAKAFAKQTGAPHGFLIPAFIAVSNDGDIRVFGGGLGPGLLPSMKRAHARAAFGPYIAPEVAASGVPSLAGDIYSMAAILFETLTGKRLSDGRVDEQLGSAVLSLNGNPLPEDLSALLARALSPDPAGRPSDIVSYKKELGRLLYGGPYAPSTFNLAFFMHQQFERAIEKERREIAQEELIDPRPLIAAEDEAARASDARAAAPPREVTVPKFGVQPDTDVGHTLGGTPIAARKGPLAGIPVPVVAAIVLVLAGLGAWLTLGRSPKPAPAPPTPVPVVAAPTAVPTPAPPPTPFFAGKDDPDFQKAVAAKMAEEEKKIQVQIAKKQEAEAKRRKEEQAHIDAETKKARDAEDALKAARERTDKEEAARLAREAADARQREEAARAAAAAAAAVPPRTRTGDLIDVSQTDTQPRATKVVKPEPTAMALRQHISGTVMLRVLVDENGRAETIEVLRDTTPRAGLAESCRTALKKWEWTPATKDGQRVKTWIVVPIPFQRL